MKNKFGVFLIYFLEILLIVGCSSQQPTMTAPAIPKQTNLPLSAATPTPLPTFTPLSPLHTTHTSPLPKGIFEPFQESIFDPTTVQGNDDIIKTAFGVIHQDSVVEEKILVDSALGYVVFSLFWEEGNLDLTLIQPDGKEINSLNSKSGNDFRGSLMDNDPSYFISSISDSGSKKYYIFAPQQTGAWAMRISGKSTPDNGSNYMIQVTSMVATGLYNLLEKKEYFSGDPITVSFGVTYDVAYSPERQYIHGVSMKITVEDPAKNQYSFELYDDGHHEDGKADDGVYANVFSKTSLVGKYNFYLQISGKNNRSPELFTNELFTREHFFSVEVK